MALLRIGIEASNLRESGGLTHLVELLRAAEPSEHGIGEVLVWAGEKTLDSLPKKKWLTPMREPLLNQFLLARIYWQKFKLSEAAERKCDILFVPGGSYEGNFRPYVTMNPNLLPFERSEYRRFGVSWMAFKMAILRLTQSASFRKANGMIFLTEYGRGVVMQRVKKLAGDWTIIPHGVNPAFRLAPRLAKAMADYSQTSPFHLLYVSNVYPYKHQWNVAEAVHELRQAGFWVELDLVGSAYPPALKRLQDVIKRIDPDGKFIHYHGEIPYAEMPAWYQRADGFVFASSCESFSISLLEAMTAGLPIACSNRGPMPQLLGDAGIYFDPEQQESISAGLVSLLQDKTRRGQIAQKAYERAQDYSCDRCARETLDFLAQTARRYTEIPE